MSILDFEWENLYVATDAAASWYSDPVGGMAVCAIPSEHRGDLATFRQALIEANGGRPFRIDWGEGESAERLRVKPLTTSYINPLFVIRRFRAGLSGLRDLGFPPGIIKRLLDEPIEPGLILFLGGQKAGKTTAANAFVVEHVAEHGGVAFTVEAPAEIDIEGSHGKGRVIQTEVEDEADLGVALRGLLRSGASLLFCGEVTRDSAAREVVAIATAGQPVVTTYHSPDVVTGLRRFAEAAGENYGAFADALTAVFYLERGKRRLPNLTGEGPPGAVAAPLKPLRVSPLVMTSDAREMIRSNLRAGTFEQLKSEMERQMAMFLRGDVPR